MREQRWRKKWREYLDLESKSIIKDPKKQFQYITALAKYANQDTITTMGAIIALALTEKGTHPVTLQKLVLLDINTTMDATGAPVLEMDTHARKEDV
ncbi:hypothetical protein Bhyg_14552 [Pseudolycoriella hygida]|uniref:Uncharacterized protein n=1 Tax=Pseudolycoriella hygida TaxID=35572 RepID=A0A9Q0RXE0_9DIPT|nr:hypothetical protein Bhyg_14552 [Pseudolycoriella hygida]